MRFQCGGRWWHVGQQVRVSVSTPSQGVVVNVSPLYEGALIVRMGSFTHHLYIEFVEPAQ